MIQLCLSVPYSNEIVERFFSFIKVVKSDWRSKLSEENIKALPRMEVEGLETEQFIEKHFSDAAAFWWNAKEQRKGGNWKQKKI